MSHPRPCLYYEQHEKHAATEGPEEQRLNLDDAHVRQGLWVQVANKDNIMVEVMAPDGRARLLMGGQGS